MKRQSAFTIAECLAALIVTSLVILLISGAMTMVRTANRQSLANSVDWYICLRELESAEHHFALKKVTSNRIELFDLNQKRDYQLQAFDRLYLRAPEGGYMPIFSRIRSGETTFRRLDQQRVYIEVRRTNGEKLAGTVCFEKS